MSREDSTGGILIIRGGAIGDFILTLPALALLREAFPQTPLEILGYPHIASLAEGRYTCATRSIEYAGLASFFVPGGALPDDLAAYFAGFSQVISYLYDPDGFFEANLRRAGVKRFIAGPPRVDPAPGSAHASRQLARALEPLALFPAEGPEGETASLDLGPQERAFAEAFLDSLHAGFSNDPRPILAVHPGSGGKAKLWPVEAWQRLLERLRQAAAQPDGPRLLFVGGEADTERLAALRREGEPLAWNLPLPRLAAVLARSTAFLGHDSGISHLAAAVRTPSLLLFGPTDPAIWAPGGGHVRVLRAPEGDLARLMPEAVFAALDESLA